MQKKASRLAYICHDTTENMRDMMKKHPDMPFREMMMMVCKEKGIDLDDGHHSDHSDSCP